MRIAVDVSPLTTGHKVRGIGFYVKNLLTALKRYYPEHEYIEFTGNAVPKNADIVHYPYFDPFSLTLSFFSSKPTVVTVHDLTPLVLHQLFPVGLKGMLAWRLQRLALLRVSRVITDSVASKNDIEHYVGLLASKIDVVHLAAGEHFGQQAKSTIEKVKKKYNLPKEFVLYVGDVTPNKNVARLVNACLQARMALVIAGSVFTDAKANITHPWTKDLKKVRKIVRENGDTIRLLGFVPDTDLSALYGAASVFALPSLYEGFGLPVVEAFACGTPVVCSDKGSLKEVAGEAALIIDPYSIESIAGGIKKVIGDKKLAATMSQKGLQRAKEFTWGKAAQHTINAYKKVIHNER
ncbi:MAG TPA: glycosyltransferase family 1 protein [Patescibacteria group bacterium]|nr:glycosyltransferase family 1 protein [Patescibacteria group bacterium]